MKKVILSILTISLLTTAFAQKVDRSKKPQAGPAPVLNIADAQTFTLDNGLKVIVVENHKLPRVTYSIQLDVDPENDGPKAGIKDLVGPLMTRGTKNLTKDQYNEAVDACGASIGASSSGVYGFALTKNQDKMLALMSDVLLNPNFKQEELEKLRTQMISGLETSKTDPEAILSNVSSKLLYGDNHPYAEITTESTLKNVMLSDVNKYYQTYFRPNVAYLAIVGDITLAEAKEKANKYFGKWQKQDVPVATYPAVPMPSKTTVDFANRDGAVQSVIGVTYPIELKPGTDDLIKTRILNEILGGSSQGRLFKNLRENKAWTYGSYSSISPDDQVGNVQLYSKARNIVTDSAITEILKEMKTIRNEKISADEINAAKNFISGKFALGLESPQTIASYAINIDKYKLPKDYYRNYLKKVQAVTVEELQATANKFIQPDNAHIIVVGNKSEIEKLKKFTTEGKLNFYDNYGNPTAPIEVKSINGVTAEQVIKNYISAIGGESAIKGLNSMALEGTATLNGASFSYTSYTTSPNKHRTLIAGKMPGMSEGSFMEMKMVYNDKKGQISQNSMKMDMGEDELASYEVESDLQSILNPAKYGISYTLVGIEQVNNIETYNVEKVYNNGNSKDMLFFDVKTGLLIREISTQNNSTSIKNYNSYKEVKDGNGFKVPFETSVTGAQPYTIKLNSAKANTTIKDNIFKL